jgi:uncharacterized protein
MKTLTIDIEKYAKNHFSNDHSGHDWHHVNRVRNLALSIQEKEGGDREIIELASLLHDISDHKLNGGILNINGDEAKKTLLQFGADDLTAQKVKEIVDTISFKGANVPDAPTSIEAKIIQDADRLDAMGAIGIARTFAYGGSRNQPIFDDKISVKMHDSFEEYASGGTHTINHFYEKLLLLKERLHTQTAIKIGEKRHLIMQNFLDDFFEEWNQNNIKTE